MTAVAADHYQVAVLLFGQTMNLLARLSVDQVPLFSNQLRIAFSKDVYALAVLLELLTDHGAGTLIHR